MRLSCGEGSVLAPDDFLALSAPRTRLGAFGAVAGARVLLEVVPTDAPLAGAVPLGSPHVVGGEVRLEGDRLLARVPADPYAAEAVLRIAWQVAVHRGGGLLMHGCAFHWEGRGVAAIGQSGAGKSTLARMARGHPAHATLLTDEIVQLTGDGRVFGTPFRSDADNAGSPGPARLAGVLLLAHGAAEEVAPVAAVEALPVLLGQRFVPVIPVASEGEIRRRVLALVDRVGVHRLTFRKDPAVGPFLREWVSRP